MSHDSLPMLLLSQLSCHVEGHPQLHAIASGLQYTIQTSLSFDSIDPETLIWPVGKTLRDHHPVQNGMGAPTLLAVHI